MKYIKLFENWNNTYDLKEEFDYGSVLGILQHDFYGITDVMNKYGDSEDILRTLQDNYEDLFPIAILKNINVFDSKRGSGYGKKLYKIYEDWAVLNECEYSLLVSDSEENQSKGFDLDRWYISLGYTKIGSINDNSVMIKDLI